MDVKHHMRPSLRLIDYFDKGVALDPDCLFLVDEHGSSSYGQTQLFSHRLANALASENIVPGTRIAVYSANATRAFECVIGIIRRGCIWVPVNIRNTVADTIYVLNNTGTRVLFFSDAFSAEVEQILSGCPGITHAICIDSDSGRHMNLEAIIVDMPDVSEDIPADSEAVITLFSSGGTTGKPKGVMMPHRAWETMIAGLQILTWHERPVHLVAAPMTHAAGGSALIMAPMGTTNIMLPGFDPVGVMQAIQEHRVTHLFLPPTAIYRLLSHPDVRKYDYSSLRFFNFASAPMAADKVREAIDVFGPVMMTGLGSTELGVNVTFMSPPELVRALAEGNDQRLESCGRATLFARVEIMDDDGNLLPSGTPGEIVVRSSQVMKAYHNNEAETHSALAGGWYHTGDIGYRDRDGYFYLVDRKRDIIISGGFNVFPSEVEKVIIGHPGVQDCAVIGVPDEDWGEAVKAVIELKPGQKLEVQEIEDHCRRHLSRFKVPKSFEFTSELPRSAAGKVLRRVVREPYWEGRQRRI